jgi:hypothetical protein
MMLALARWFAAVERAKGTTDVIDQATQAANDVFALHPEQILRFLEESWAYGSQSLPDFKMPKELLYGQAPGFESGLHKRLSAVNGTIYGTLPTWDFAPPDDSGTGARWDHLIYAYLIENTRLLPIFFRVVTEFLHGERLEVPSLATQQWLRTTEALFMRDLPSRSIGAIACSGSTSTTEPTTEHRTAMYGPKLPTPASSVPSRTFSARCGRHRRTTEIPAASTAKTTPPSRRMPGTCRTC